MRQARVRIASLEDLGLISKKQTESDSTIVIGDNIIGRLGYIVESLLGGRRLTSVVIITDSNVERLYWPLIRKVLVKKFGTVQKISLTPGEKNKTLDTSARILETLSEKGVERNGVIVALGGGVVGDIAGFVASIYLRGLSYFQVPTTLLAQVDSSIGGKTGVDTTWGKNQIGTFYQPLGVVIDPSFFLKSLPAREILNGVGEIIKYAIIQSPRLFYRLEHTSFQSINELAQIIDTCCRIKARIVSQDERDRNLRAILNYGHTIGHAIEASSNYRIDHGKAVLIGMFCEGKVAYELGIYDSDSLERQNALIMRALGSLKIVLPETKEILRFAMKDKKNLSKKLMMIFPERIGKVHSVSMNEFRTPVSIDIVKSSVLEIRSIFS